MSRDEYSDEEGARLRAPGFSSRHQALRDEVRQLAFGRLARLPGSMHVIEILHQLGSHGASDTRYFVPLAVDLL